jgi:hypothetical protein
MPAAIQTKLVPQSFMMVAMLPALLMLQVLSNECFMYLYPEASLHRLRVMAATTGITLLLTIAAVLVATMLHDSVKASTTVRTYTISLLMTPLLLLLQTLSMDVFYWVDPKPTKSRFVLVLSTTLISMAVSAALCILVCSKMCECMRIRVESFLCYETDEVCVEDS